VSDQSGFVDLGPLLPRLEIIAGILLAPVPPAALQQGVAEQIRNLLESVAVLPGLAEGEERFGWLGLCDGAAVDLIREDLQISGVLAPGGRLMWADLHREDGSHWHLVFEALGESSIGGEGSRILGETRMLIEISLPDGAVFSTHFTHDGRIVDCLDPEPGFQAAAEHFQQSLQSLDEVEDGEVSLDGEGAPMTGESGPGQAGEGFELPGGAMGGRLLCGAVAGLAGAAAAAARKANADAGDAADGRRKSDTPAAPSPSPEEPRPTPAPPQPALDETPQAEWYFAAGNEKRGPLTLEQLGTRFSSGEIPPETLVWRAGLVSWKQASELGELSRWMPRRPPELPASERQWFYAVAEQRVGPVAESHLKAWLSSGQLPWEIPVWREGLDQWLPASSFPELRG